MKTDIWMPIYIGDFLKDTTHLNTEETSLYLLILVHLWNNEGTITIQKLARILRFSDKKMRKKLKNFSEFFSCMNGELFQKRLFFEWEKSQQNREIRSEVGKLGGRPKTKRKPIGKPIANQKGNQNKTPSPSPSPSYILTREEYDKSLQTFRDADNSKWISSLKQEYTDLDIPKCLKKIATYWATDEGFAHKLKSKSKSIRWKATFENGLTMEWNQILKQTKSMV